jgi:hypothetical protein
MSAEMQPEASNFSVAAFVDNFGFSFHSCNLEPMALGEHGEPVPLPADSGVGWSTEPFAGCVCFMSITMHLPLAVQNRALGISSVEI